MKVEGELVRIWKETGGDRKGQEKVRGGKYNKYELHRRECHK